MNDAQNIWGIVVEKLSEELTPISVQTWIEPCEPVEYDGNRLILRVKDEFRKNILAERFSPVITKILEDLLPGGTPELVILSGEDRIPGEQEKTEDDMPCVPGYTFADFIVGPSNKFAHAASVAVSESPGTRFNPLFIYGSSGLGKTHLMLAIGYAIRERTPEKKVCYVKGESFMNELIQAIQEGTTKQFKEHYRSVDVLLIDDIQFIAGKQSTQIEFFHTFNELYQTQRQIVITSDRPPMEMTLLDDRLRTRFEGGLMADIAPPDLETRIAIAKSKAALIDLSLPDEDTVYIASKVKSNIRKLEGVLNKLGAYSSIMNIPVTREMIDRVIAEVDCIEGVPTAEAIIRETGKYYSLTPEQLKSENRSGAIKTARQVAMYLMRTLTSMSFQEIGAAFGRNHSTVINSVTRIDEQMRTDARLKGVIRDIESNITNTPGNRE